MTRENAGPQLAPEADRRRLMHQLSGFSGLSIATITSEVPFFPGQMLRADSDGLERAPIGVMGGGSSGGPTW